MIFVYIFVTIVLIYILGYILFVIFGLKDMDTAVIPVPIQIVYLLVFAVIWPKLLWDYLKKKKPM